MMRIKAPSRAFLFWVMGISGSLFCALLIAKISGLFPLSWSTQAQLALTKTIIADAFREQGTIEEFPRALIVPVGQKQVPVMIEYSLDEKLQKGVEKLFHSYRPDYGAFVALDAETGRILAMISYVGEGNVIEDNLALRATFPSASVFKVVTAAAAIAEKNFSADTIISFNGRNHTLYKYNVLKDKRNRWTRDMKLKEAFAKSVNTVFGKIGALSLETEELRKHAQRFGFNRRIAADIPVQIGRSDIDDTPWSRAEAASGFTRNNTMSPLHGAMIAASVVNGGTMMQPFAVEAVYDSKGDLIYRSEAAVAFESMDPQTAAEVRTLMQETVRRGTSRRTFRRFFRGDLADLEVGGKTGSLSGMSPKGKYDWFVGYGDDGVHKIAFAAMTVHEKYWRVKSTYIARRALEMYYKDPQRIREAHPPALKARGKRVYSNKE